MTPGCTTAQWSAVYQAGCCEAYAEHAGHCAFTTAELVAAVLTMDKRIPTGRRDAPAEPHQMRALADSLGLDSGAFIRYHVPKFLGDRPAPPPHL